jgi:hypothetical protein
MTRTIKHLLIFFTIFLIFLSLILCCVKLRIITPCVFTSDATTSSVVVNRHIHELIDSENIKVCHIEVNKTKYKAWLTFKNSEENNYVYWLSVDTSFSFNNQTSSINVDFGTLSIIKYAYYSIF